MPAQTNGKRNKNAGHSWERESAEEFREIGFDHVVTSRSESRGRDAQKIDLMNKDELVNGRLPYDVQCKSLSKACPYPKFLSEIEKTEGVIPVVVHKQTKLNAAGRFMTQGKYAIMYLSDFYTIVRDRLRLSKLEEGFKEVMKYIDYVPDRERVELETKLAGLGL